jgi:hypothetical protein
MARRNELDYGCGDGTLINISAGEYYPFSGSYISNSLPSHRKRFSTSPLIFSTRWSTIARIS